MAQEYLIDDGQIPVGEMQAIEVNGEGVLLFHLQDGYFATQAKCPHLFMPLAKGKLLDGERIQCKFHRAEFDVRSGKACKWANFPPGIQALNFVRGEKDLATYAIKVEDGRVYAEI